MRKKTKRWILGIVVGIVLLLAWIVLLSPWVWPAPGMDSLVVGRETTWLENPPMNPDGTVNYEKAITDRMTAGITPENNAMVCFLHAVGTDEITRASDGYQAGSDEWLERYFGQPSSAFKGPFLTDVENETGYVFHPNNGDTTPAMGHLLFTPWTDPTYPSIRHWVDRNTTSLDWMVKGSRRPRCSFFQRSPKDDPPIMGMNWSEYHHWGIYRLQQATKGLLLRAMGSLSHGKGQSAWDDTMAVRRIARLCFQGCTSHQEQIGLELEDFAIKAQQAILASDALDIDQTTAWLEELQALPQLPDASIARDIKVLQALSTTNDLENPNDGRGLLFQHFMLMPESEWLEHIPRLSTPLSMQQIVKAFRQEEAIENIPTVLERKYAEWDAICYWWAKPIRPGHVTTLALGTPAARQRALIDMITFALTRQIPSGPVPWSQMRSIPQTRADLTRVMAAMAVYRAKHKQWPATLEDLVPAILPRVPADPWSDSQAPLKYKPAPNGFLLYSLGYNETDDGGVDPGSSAGIYELQEGDVSISVPRLKESDEPDQP